MLTQNLIDYYVKLLILQYLGQPKAYAHIRALVTPVIMDQLPLDVQDAFNIETTVGVQLDTFAKYVGVSRSGVGFLGQQITLDDDDFRSFIKIAIIQNQSGSSLSVIQNFIYTYFPNQLFLYDKADMSLDYLISSTVGSQDLLELFITEGLLPRPMGVEVSSIIYLPTLDVFGFITYENTTGLNIYPFNTYEDYNETWHWLDYSDAIII